MTFLSKVRINDTAIIEQIRKVCQAEDELDSEMHKLQLMLKQKKAQQRRLKHENTSRSNNN